jgi:hypothetical protein
MGTDLKPDRISFFCSNYSLLVSVVILRLTAFYQLNQKPGVAQEIKSSLKRKFHFNELIVRVTGTFRMQSFETGNML